MKNRIIFMFATAVFISVAMAPGASAKSADDYGKKLSYLHAQTNTNDSDDDRSNKSDKQYKKADSSKSTYAKSVYNKDKFYISDDGQDRHKKDHKNDLGRGHDGRRSDNDHSENHKNDGQNKSKYTKVAAGKGGGVALLTPATTAPVAVSTPNRLPQTGGALSLLIPTAGGIFATGYAYLRRKRLLEA